MKIQPAKIDSTSALKPFITLGDSDDWYVHMYQLKDQYLLEVGGEHVNNCVGSYLINESQAETYLREVMRRKDICEVTSETQDLSYEYGQGGISASVQTILDKKLSKSAQQRALAILKNRTFRKIWADLPKFNQPAPPEAAPEPGYDPFAL